jgi:hypothetical protein
MTAAPEPEKMSAEEVADLRARLTFDQGIADWGHWAMNYKDAKRLLATYDSLKSRAERLEKALEMLYDKWENGESCHEVVDGEADGAFMGNAFDLTKAEEDSILALLPKDARAA